MEDAVGGGATYLVSRSLTKSEGRMTCIHPFDVTYHMKMAKFARSLSRARREEFAQLIQATSTISKKYYELSDVPNKYLKSVIPSSYSLQLYLLPTIIKNYQSQLFDSHVVPGE
jgi:hypothetical protein